MPGKAQQYVFEFVLLLESDDVIGPDKVNYLKLELFSDPVQNVS